jgi:hypothetical protein
LTSLIGPMSSMLQLWLSVSCTFGKRETKPVILQQRRFWLKLTGRSLLTSDLIKENLVKPSLAPKCDSKLIPKWSPPLLQWSFSIRMPHFSKLKATWEPVW